MTIASTAAENDGTVSVLIGVPAAESGKNKAWNVFLLTVDVPAD